MPGAVPITSTHALTNATLPYVIELAEQGIDGALEHNPGLRMGLNVRAGEIIHPAVAEALQLSGARQLAHTRTPRHREALTMASTAETLSNFVDGELVPAEGDTEPVLNPATGEELARAPVSSAEEVGRAVAAARRAFDGWSQTTPAQRAEALLALADVDRRARR